jgi:SAM-dependent methyltransferase
MVPRKMISPKSNLLAVILFCVLSALPSCRARPTFWSNRLADRTCLATSRRGRRKPSSSEGFGKAQEPTAPKPAATTPTSPDNGDKPIYSMPALYDMAFGYRNYEVEVDFLVGQHQLLHNGKPPAKVLELAAGPARHSIFALQASMVQSATCLDNSPEMVKYGMEVAEHELDAELLPNFTYLEQDMQSFDFPGDELFDSCWILLGSLQHLTENTQVISCFESIHKALQPDGTLILELPHPRETFSLIECTRNGWEVPLEDENGEETGELEIIWGDDDDEFDPIKQVRQFTVSMNVKGVEKSDMQSVREVVPMRHFTTQEIDALGRIAGFEIDSLHGALADGVNVNDQDEAFRLVCVLRKRQ